MKLKFTKKPKLKWLIQPRRSFFHPEFKIHGTNGSDSPVLIKVYMVKKK